MAVFRDTPICVVCLGLTLRLVTRKHVKCAASCGFKLATAAVQLKTHTYSGAKVTASVTGLQKGKGVRKPHSYW